MNQLLTKSFAVVLMSFVALSACSKKQEVKPDDNLIPTAANADENEMGDSDSGKAMGLQTVHFGYDSYVLEASAKSVMMANAQILKDKPSVKIQIEGHCDQRGGIQYNLALGEKRANAVKKFMLDQGIASNRMSVISFGKEKLLNNADSEEAHAQNRRATFVITGR